MKAIDIHKIGIGFGQGDRMAVSAVRDAFAACMDQICLERVAVVASGDMSLEDAANAAKYAQDHVGDDVKLSVNLAYKAGSDTCTAYVITFAKEEVACCGKCMCDKYDPDEIVYAIISTVCATFGIDFCDMVSDHEKLEFQLPRELIMFYCRELTDMDLDMIGSVTKDGHAVVMAAISKITNLISTKENLRPFIRYLEQEILEQYQIKRELDKKVTNKNEILFHECKIKGDAPLREEELPERVRYTSYMDVIKDIDAETNSKSIAYFWMYMESPDFEESIEKSLDEKDMNRARALTEIYSWLFDHSIRKGGIKELNQICERVASSLYHYTQGSGQSRCYNSLDESWLDNVILYKLKGKNIKDYMFAVHYDSVKDNKWNE